MSYTSLINKLTGTTLGLDIGSEFVKLIALRGEGNNKKIYAKGIFKRSDHQGVFEAIKHPSLKGSQLRVNIDDASLQLGQIQIPKVPPKEREEVIKWALKNSLKKPVVNYIYKVVNNAELLMKSDPNKEDLIFFAALKEDIDKRLAWFAHSSIKNIEILEPCANAVSNCVLHNYQPKKDEIYGILDIGRTMSSFSAVNKNGLLFNFVLDKISLNALVLSVGYERQLSEAESAILVDKCLEENCDEDEIARSFISILCIKVQEALDEFELKFPEQKICQLLLVGGGSFLPKIEYHLENIFSFKVELINPFNRIKAVEKNLFSSDARIFAVAVGLAL